MKHYKSQLRSLDTGAAVAISGGAVYVTATGGTAKAALTDKNGASITNPQPLTNGVFDFYTADSLGNVDLYIVSPTGHMVIRRNLAPSGDASIAYSHKHTRTDLVIPFNIADTTATTETDTGFDLLANSIVLPVSAGLCVEVKTLESGKTIDFGTAEAIAETGGDADGMASALSTTAAVTVLSAVSTGVVVATHTSITYTLSSGAVAAAGFLRIPVSLPTSSL